MKKYILQSVMIAVMLFSAACGKNSLELSPDKWRLTDFEGCFDKNYQTSVDEYKIAADSEEENSVTALYGGESGPTIYIVAGIHGDERASIVAAELLKSASIKSGTVYIVSPANRYGAENNQRLTKGARDLNRNFPGDPDGCDAERIACSIFEDIRMKKPSLVLDLHEAVASEQNSGVSSYSRDALGNTVICQSLDGIGELMLNIILLSESGELCSAPFGLYGSPPIGSINKTATEKLSVPTITIETLRSEPLAQRVRNQLELVEYVFEYYGLR